MNVVAWALRRPVQVLVVVLALALLALGALRNTPRDVLPQLGIPTVYVAQPYGGMSPEQMEGFLTYYYEYHFLYLTGIEHVESRSIQGTALIKLQFHPGTDMAQAMSETVAYVNRSRAFMPPGTVPPFIMRFDAGSVPVGNLVFSSDTLPVAAIQDAALNRVRPLFATLPGVSAPPPFGGSARTVVIRVQPDRLHAHGLSPDDVVRAVTSGSTVSPAGTANMGERDPMVPSNALISNLAEYTQIPLKPRLYLGDVATVSDASDIATGYALINGKRTVYIPVTKRSNASTLEVVDLVKKNLGKFQAALPEGVVVSYQFDQSQYIQRALLGLLQEGLLGACLSGLMVWLFLRDRISALIVILNIPLALAGALLGLSWAGQTVNLMTLGGLALAVGILVDESTVTIESIHAHLSQGKSLPRAVSDSGAEVALPLLVSLLCILAVFVPSFFMTGVARALFSPLALAVGAAMVASYALSRTLVPVLCCWWLPQRPSHGVSLDRLPLPGSGKAPVALAYMVLCSLLLALLAPSLGQEIFPAVDQGQFQLRLKAPAGTHLEHTEELVRRVSQRVAARVGPENLQVSLAFVGTQAPSYPINTIYLWTSGPEEGVVQFQLRPGVVPIERLKEWLRADFAREFPEVRFSFEPSDVINRVLSFGSTTPVEVAVSGPDFQASRQFAEKVLEALKELPELRDVQLGQQLDFPALAVDIDRVRAGELGATAEGVARSLVAGTSSSRFTSPNYWADPKSGIAYSVQIEVPRERMASQEDLLNLPVTTTRGATLLRNLARVRPGVVVGEYDRYNMQRTISVQANFAGSDLGRVSARVRHRLKQLGPAPPRVSVQLRGLLPPLQEMRQGLQQGLLMATVTIVLLLWANFQSLAAALTVLGVLPGCLTGVVLMLWGTSTSLNLQSFMGAIMSVGVGVANSILLVSAARRLQLEGQNAATAGRAAARTRLRPILMTSLAMGMGMLPMALGLGEGGQQVAPLGRAVLGGLAGSTLAALLVLPTLYAWFCSRSHGQASLDPDDPSSPHFEGGRP
jgi:multidrug efflux pump subunit AcrB